MEMHTNITVFDTPDILGEAAAIFIRDRTAESIKRNGRFTIALSGGSTPEILFAKLSQAPYGESIDWENVFVFWGDERSVPLDDERNNAHKAKMLLLDRVSIPEKNIYRIQSDQAPENAAGIYEDTIKRFFENSVTSFDLILLGLGADGHTASLFPFTGILTDKSHLVASQYVEDQGMHRITMTPLLINLAREVLFLVSGEEKAAILDTIINGNRDEERYPAQMINPQSGGLYWYIDKGAAKSLKITS